MKVAICDDNFMDLRCLQDILWTYNASLMVTAYNSASELLRAFDSIFYDIVFMDIEMEKPNGYEAAEILMQRKEKPLIIFVTNSGEYTIRGYGVAFRYMPKPVSLDAVSMVMDLALEQIMPQKLEIDMVDKKMYLSVSDIFYVEAHRHVAVVALETRSIQCKISLKRLEKQLPAHGFARPHNSYIVNLDKVNFMEKTSIQMINGAVIPVSQRYAKAFDLTLTQFIRRH